MDPVFKRPGIRESIEWKLLEGLRLQSHRLAPVQVGDTHGTSRRKNELRQLNIELRKALTRSDMAIILDFDDESGGDNESDDDNFSDAIEKAEFMLRGVCKQLNGMANLHWLPANLNQHVHSVKSDPYPSISALLEHLQSPTSATRPLELISGPDSLFTVSKQAVQEILRQFGDFNIFVDTLRLSGSSLEELASPKASASHPSDREFDASFRHQALAALRVIFSGFAKCMHGNTAGHRVLIELPRLEGMTPDHASDQDFQMQLFLSSCQGPCKWQEAKIQFMSPRVSGGVASSLCSAISDAQEVEDGLELLHVVGSEEILISDELRTPKKYKDEEPIITLHKLVEGEAFRKFRPGRGPTKFDIFGDDDKRNLAISLVLGLLVCLDADHTVASWDSTQVYLATKADCSHLRGFTHVFCVANNKSESEKAQSHLSLPDLDMAISKKPPPLPAFTTLAKVLLEIGFGECLDSITIDPEKCEWDSLRKEVDKGRKELPTSGDIRSLPYLAAAENCLFFHRLYATEARRLGTRNSNSLTVATNIVFDKILSEINTSSTGAERTLAGPNARARRVPVPPRPSRRAHGDDDRESSEMPRGTQRLRYSSPRPRQQAGLSFFDDSGDISPSAREVVWGKNFFGNLESFQTSCAPYMDLKSRRVKIAVIDTGVSLSHGGIQAAYQKRRIRKEWCRSWVGSPSDIGDHDGHGTHMAHLLHRVAPEADIYVAKVFRGSSFDMAEAENIAQAITYAVTTWDVDIISMSFGLHQPSSSAGREKWGRIVENIKNAIEGASLQRLFFAAASNGGKNARRTFPAKNDHVICIHAADGNGNDGGINPDPEDDEINFMTLGVAVPLIDEEVGDVYRTGTSFATPIAAGIAANILAMATDSAPNELSPSARKEMWKPWGMRKTFRLMATKGEYRYVAPWRLWPENWQHDPEKRKHVWSEISNKLKGW